MHCFTTTLRLLLHIDVIHQASANTSNPGCLLIAPLRFGTLWPLVSGGKQGPVAHPWSNDFREKCQPCACFLDIFITYSTFVQHLALKSCIGSLLDIYCWYCLVQIGSVWTVCPNIDVLGAHATVMDDIKTDLICKEWYFTHLPGLIQVMTTILIP